MASRPKRETEEFSFSPSLLLTLLGALAILAGLAAYPAALSHVPVLSPESLRFLESLAYVTLTLVIIGLVGVIYGVQRILRSEGFRLRTKGGLPPSTFSMVSYVLGERVYGRVSNLSSFAYGSFYALVSGLVVYQPWLRFSEAYLAKIPSILIVPCCGPVGQVPQIVVYLTEHLGFLIVPLNLILLFAVSWLVGLNSAFAFFAYKNRPPEAGGRWFSGLGAVVALFTGCPTCAGLLFSTVVGGVGAVSVAIALASLQTLFIAISIPVLLVAPFLTSRNLLKTFGGKCVVTK